MALFDPANVGAFQLEHRIVSDPILKQCTEAQIESYINGLNLQGGLFLAPIAITGASEHVQTHAIQKVHQQKGVIIAQICDGNTHLNDIKSKLLFAAQRSVELGYDGIEINAGSGSALERVLHEDASAVSKLVEIIESLVTIVTAEKIGIRITPFDILDGLSLSKPLLRYGNLIDAIKQKYPKLGFIHCVAHKLFDEFEHASNQLLDHLRNHLGSGANEITFISEDAYEYELACATASRTNDLIAIGLPSEWNPDLVVRLRNQDELQLPEAVKQSLQTIRSKFEGGKEYVMDWSTEQDTRINKAMNDLDTYLSDFDPSLSYEGTDKKVVWRKSCWFASDGIARPFLDTRESIAAFDGDLEDGLTGLRALHDRSVRSSMEYLKAVLDSALVTTSNAIGLDGDMIQRCTVRYRVIKYTPHAGAPGGIGLHPDGNLLSALITNGEGLRVYNLDGSVVYPGWNGTIMMGGSTLYRWSEGRYIPTFHDVDISGDQVKVSIVAFFNFPDMVNIPRSVEAKDEKKREFFHNIRKIKEDDKLPTGELSRLWDVIIDRHKIVLPPAVTAS